MGDWAEGHAREAKCDAFCNTCFVTMILSAMGALIYYKTQIVTPDR